MKITSPDFQHSEMIPEKFTCEGEDINPSLKLEDIPANALTLALIVDDPDAPSGTFVHWVVFNIQPTSQITSDSIPGTQGMNDFKKVGYGGPCPPKGTGVHRYFFKFYALDTKLDLAEGISKEQLESAMKDHILEQAELMGKYTKDR